MKKILKINILIIALFSLMLGGIEAKAQINNRPVAYDQTVTTDQDVPIVITLTATDEDGDMLIYQRVGDDRPAHGDLVLLDLETQSYTYTPHAGYSGEDSFSFQVSDGKVDSEPATVTIIINGTTSANTPPVANDLTVTTGENTPKSITLSATDADEDMLEYIVADPSHGSLDKTNLPNVIYTPYAGYSGADSFTFKAFDGKEYSDIATVSITVNAANRKPVANDLTVTTGENTPKSITLSATDEDEDMLEYVVADPSHGSLDKTNLPNVIYTPYAGYSGADSFTFKAFDGKEYSNIATVSITVNAANHKPVANDLTVTTGENTPKSITLSATDADEDVLEYVVADPSHGSLDKTNLPNVIYTPYAGYSGADSFTFKVWDGKEYSNIATVSITVNPNQSNQPPHLDDQTLEVNQGDSLTITLQPTGGSGNNWTVQNSRPRYGALSEGSNSLSAVYTPRAGFLGQDSFTVRVSDGTQVSNTVTITITVKPAPQPPVNPPGGANHAPVAIDQDLTGVRNQPLQITLTASDADGDALDYQAIVVPRQLRAGRWVGGSPANGTLTGDGANLIYTPDTNFRGRDSFEFMVTDGTEISYGVITITIR